MQTIAYLIVQAIVMLLDLLVLLGLPALPEQVEIMLWDIAYFLVNFYHFPINLGFDA